MEEKIMNKILIGWAEESIVPDKKVDLAGQFFERISEYVESDISVTAMAVESQGEQMILVSADVVSINGHVLECARQKLAALTDEVDAKKLIVCATHTHTSMRLSCGDGKNTFKVDHASAILNEFLPEDKKYTKLVTADESVITPCEATELVSEKIALAAKKAWEEEQKRAEANGGDANAEAQKTLENIGFLFYIM